MVFLNVSAFVVGLVNLAVGSNYMFLMRKPDTASPLDLLGPHPVYIFVEELIALTLFILMYIVFLSCRIALNAVAAVNRNKLFLRPAVEEGIK